MCAVPEPTPVETTPTQAIPRDGSVAMGNPPASDHKFEVRFTMCTQGTGGNTLLVDPSGSDYRGFGIDQLDIGRLFEGPGIKCDADENYLSLSQHDGETRLHVVPLLKYDPFEILLDDVNIAYLKRAMTWTEVAPAV